jgi:hypothetical protein
MKKSTRYFSVLLIASSLVLSSSILPTSVLATSAVGGNFHIGGGFLRMLGGFFRVGRTSSQAATSPLGINLGGVTYYSSEQPLLDIFKEDSGWITQTNSTFDTLEESKIDLDANGWPQSLGGSGGQSVTYTKLGILLERQGYPNYPAGQYVVLYDGQGTLNYSFDAVKNVALSTTGRDVLDVTTPSGSGILITLTATDPGHTGNYVRNIRLVKASNESLLNSGELFNPTFVNLIRPFSTLRFMDWGKTNSATAYSSGNPPIVSNSGNWADRTTSSYAFWGAPNGVPVETMVALLNKTGANGWFNMPVTATDNYLTQYATLVHNTLTGNKTAYIEYSNELWNGAFTANAYAAQQGEALWPTALSSGNSAYNIGLNWYAMRTAQMCDIWKSVWGADAGRVVCVMGSQAANTTITNTVLACALWSGAPCATNHGIGAVAIAPYFGYTVPDSWTSDPDGGLGKLFTEINSGGLAPGGYAGGMIAQAVSWIAPQKTIANSYGLDLVAYEGGQTLVDQNDATTTTLYVAANRDARMGTATASYMQAMQSAGLRVFNYFNDAGDYSKYGMWGSMESILSTSTPKYDALISYIHTAPPASDTTAPSVPINLSATAVSSSAINLSWSASTDGVGVQGYRVFRSGVQIASTGSTSYGDTNLTASTTYSYTVVGYDAAGNQSAQSGSASATTGGVGLTPAIIGNGAFTFSGSTETATAANLGTASSTRFVIVSVAIGGCSGRSISSATIGGVTATVNYTVHEGALECVGFISALVPTGSTGDIVVTMTSTMFGGGSYAVYTIDQASLSSTTPTTGSANTAGGTSESPSVSAAAGAFVLGVDTFGNGSAAKNPVTVSGGFTKDIQDALKGFFHLSSVSAGTTTPTISWTGTFSSQSALTAWR